MSAIGSSPGRWWPSSSRRTSSTPCAPHRRPSPRPRRNSTRPRPTTSARNFFSSRDVASRVQYERAEQTQETARAQLDSAEAQLKIAEDQVSDTELKADAGGIVIATAAEPGEVVQAGQLIIRVAPKGGRDAVFDVPGPGVAVGAERTARHGEPDGRSGRDDHRARPGGFAAGRSRHQDIRGQGRPDRSARGHAARRDRHRTRATRQHPRRSRFPPPRSPNSIAGPPSGSSIRRA